MENTMYRVLFYLFLLLQGAAASSLAQANVAAEIPQIFGLELDNPATGKRMEILTSEHVLDELNFNLGFSIAANVSPVTRSVQFWVNGKLLRTENLPPYTLNGDSPDGSYYPYTLPAGSHEIKVIPFSEARASGTQGIPKTLNLYVSPSLESSYGLEQFSQLVSPADACPDFTQIDNRVDLNPGDDIQAIIDDPDNANANFFFVGGRGYFRLSRPLVPKAGQKFYGQLTKVEQKCVATSVLLGALRIENTDFVEQEIDNRKVWVYDYLKTNNATVLPAPVDYVFRNEQFNPQNGLYPRSVVNWACEYKPGIKVDEAVGLTPDEALINPRCSDPKTLFVNNNRLMHVDNLAALTVGTFHHDYKNQKIYLNNHPGNKNVEFAYNYSAFIATNKSGVMKSNPDEMVWKAIEEGNHDNNKAKNFGKRSKAAHWDISYMYQGNIDVEFHGLVFRHFAASNHYAALPAGISKKGWKLSHNIFEFNSGAALQIGPEWDVRHNIFRFNGQYGVVGRDAHNSTFIQNELSFNNVAGVCNVRGGKNQGDDTVQDSGDCPAAGGSKFSDSLHLDITENCSIGNTGPGLWTDIANFDVRYHNNLAARNTRAGIYHEISFAADIHHNKLLLNGENQLYLNDAKNANVQGNQLVGSFNSIFEDKILGNHLDPDAKLIPAVLQMTKRGRGESRQGKLHYSDGSVKVIYPESDRHSEMLLSGITLKYNDVYSDDDRLMLLGMTVKAHKDIDKKLDPIAFAESVFTRAQSLENTLETQNNNYYNSETNEQMFRFYKNELSNNKAFFTFDGYRTLQELKSGSFSYQSPPNGAGKPTGPNVSLVWTMEEDSDFATNEALPQHDKYVYDCTSWFRNIPQVDSE